MRSAAPPTDSREVGVPDAAGGCGAARRARAGRRPRRGPGGGDPRRRRSTPARCGALDALVARRATREPLQHLTGTAPFRHLELRVGPGVFVPRPETEMVAQLAIDALAAAASPAPDRGRSRHRQRRDRPRSRDRGAARARLRRRELGRRVRVDAGELRSWSAPTTPSSAFIDLEHAFPELDGTVSVVVVQPAVRAGCRDPARPGGAVLRSARGAVRRRRTASTSCACVSRVGLRLAHPGGIDRDRARRVAGRGDPRACSPPTAGAPPRPTPT